jgi:hypothetical protein
MARPPRLEFSLFHVLCLRQRNKTLLSLWSLIILLIMLKSINYFMVKVLLYIFVLNNQEMIGKQHKQKKKRW